MYNFSLFIYFTENNRAQFACLDHITPFGFIKKYDKKLRAWQPYHVDVIIEVVSFAFIFANILSNQYFAAL